LPINHFLRHKNEKNFLYLQKWIAYICIIINLHIELKSANNSSLSESHTKNFRMDIYGALHSRMKFMRKNQVFLQKKRNSFCLPIWFLRNNFSAKMQISLSAQKSNLTVKIHKFPPKIRCKNIFFPKKCLPRQTTEVKNAGRAL